MFSLHLVLFLFGLIAPAQAESAGYDESLLPKISFQVRQYDPKLNDYFGPGPAESLCWPSSLAHRMMYLKESKGFTRLKLKAEPSANVFKFATLCRTSKNGGTSQRRKLPCIEHAFREAGYRVKTFAVGPDSATEKRGVQVKDLLQHLRTGHAVILHVAYQKPISGKWIERGSHSLNAYGFKYRKDWNDQKIELLVANPGVDYSGEKQMTDLVQLEFDGSALVVKGRGFTDSDRRAILKNIFAFAPES